MSDVHSPQLNPWGKPHFFRCDICAALLLNEADVKEHAHWHEDVEGKVLDLSMASR